MPLAPSAALAGALKGSADDLDAEYLEVWGAGLATDLGVIVV
jgi:hypothetical protein